MDCHASPNATLADPLLGIRKKRTAYYIYNLVKNPMRFTGENKTAKKKSKRALQMPPFQDLSRKDKKPYWIILTAFSTIKRLT